MLDSRDLRQAIGSFTIKNSSYLSAMFDASFTSIFPTIYILLLLLGRHSLHVSVSFCTFFQ